MNKKKINILRNLTKNPVFYSKNYNLFFSLTTTTTTNTTILIQL